MLRKTFGTVAVIGVVAGLCLMQNSTAHAVARHSHAPPAAAKIRHIKPVRTGKPAIMQPRGRRAAIASSPDPGNMNYNGGPVQHNPTVYIVFWSDWWTYQDSTGVHEGHGDDIEQYLWNYWHGVGQSGDGWAPIMSQYGDGNSSPTFGNGVWGDWVVDTSTAPSQTASNADIAAEAVSFAENWWGISGNTDAQIIVVSPSGDNPGGCFSPYAPSSCQHPYCAWHNWATDSSGNFVTYTNMPDLLDAGTSCGENSVDVGSQSYLDGFSIVGGHEFAETVTDPGAEAGSGLLGAWYDNWYTPGTTTLDDEEIGDKCAWYDTFAETMSYVDSSGNPQSGPFAQQPLWSNAISDCQQLTNSVTVASPGNQASTLGTSVNLQIQASDTGDLYILTYAATGLPAGLSINSSTGQITGTPTTAWTYSPTVTVTDNSGASASVSFTWQTKSKAGPIKGYGSKCVDDNHSSTSNGNKIDIYSCNGTSAQKFTFAADGTLRVLGKCVKDANSGGSGSKMILYTCNSGSNEKWTHLSNGEYMLMYNGLCLADPGSSTTNGTQLVISACKDSSNQRWSLP